MRFSMPRLQGFASAVYQAAGLSPDRADTVARLQVLTDALGRRTHGLAMLPLYLAEIRKGTLNTKGDIEVVQDNGLCSVWDAHYLPGLWVIDQALQTLMPRARQNGIAALAVRRSHHIGCLAALSRQAAEQGLVVFMVNSDPAGKRVAPYGGTEALFTPNPMAYAYPGVDAQGANSPVLVDICASITTTSMTRQLVAEGREFEHPWLLDSAGLPTRDPRVLEHSARIDAKPGSLQLLGGQEYGHKGWGLALMVESLSQGLSGQGRKDQPKQWGGSTYVQVIDPALFGGAQAFAEQTGYLAEQARSNPPANPQKPVRLPGDQAAESIRRAEQEGVEGSPALVEALNQAASGLGIGTLAIQPSSLSAAVGRP
jgi:LDH2 family malate/lactate/ureidoglycolate dehydrogenase